MSDAPVGVLVMAHGTPARREDIADFYTRIRRGRTPSPEEIAELERRYQVIGGLSSFAERTAAQVDGLRAALGDGFVVRLGQKFAAPEIPDAVTELIGAGVGRIVGIVLAPHYAVASIGDYEARAVAAVDGRVPLDVIHSWHDEPELIELLASHVRDVWTDGAVLIGTAHNLPRAAVGDDTTYGDALEATTRLVAKALGITNYRVAWQSAAKTGEWLDPTLLDVIREEAEQGTPAVVVCPAGFTSEHLEIAYDLDVEAAGVATEAGIAFARTRSLDDDPALCALLGATRLSTMTMRPHVAVVGGGIAGLAAALDLIDHADVTLFEAGGRLGGPVHTVAFAGSHVDTGPDSFLARRPEMIDFVRRLGFDELVAPATGEAAVWSRGAVRKLPADLVLGVPRSTKGLAESGIVGRLGVLRASMDRYLPATAVGDDIGVGDLVRRRFGRAVQDRLVDPLLGGIHAGRSELLSAEVAAPQLLSAARGARSLMAALPDPPPSSEPVFLTVPSGLGDVIEAARRTLINAGATIHLSTPVDELESLDADGVVVSTPAPVTSRLVASVAPDAAEALSSIAYASVVLTLLAYPSAALAEPFTMTGFLVPRPEKRLMTAASWSSSKWAHHGGHGNELVRASVGRIDDRRHEEIDDASLVERLHTELEQAVGVTADAPTEALVNRWPNALPQFRVGHLKLAQRAHASAASASRPLALAGSAYEGLGLPACVASGRAAAANVLAALRVTT